MSAEFVLYTVPEFHRNLLCMLTAELSGVKLKVQSGKPSANSSNSCINLFSKIPIFTSGEVTLCDPSAIAMFMATDELKGKCPSNQAQVIQWLSIAERDILPIIEILAFTTTRSDQGVSTSSENALSFSALTKAQKEIEPILNDLNNYLKTRTFFVGERVTLADLSLFSLFHLLCKLKCAEPMMNPHKHLMRWFRTLLNMPEALKVQSGPYCLFSLDAPLCSTATTTNKGPGEQPADGLGDQPKPKNPLVVLPKGTFVIDEFKRTYCNQDTDTVAIPYLWEHFDFDNYSFWFSEYQYSDELKMLFMTSNLVNGMFQRLDSLRNHAFASVCIFGSDFKNTISGVWFWRGQDLAFPLCPDWTVDYESYKWTKLDARKPEVREMINGYLKWEPADYNELKFADGKIFK